MAIGARNEAAGEEIVQAVEADGRGRALFIKTDVSEPSQVESLVNRTAEEFGQVNVLYGNAGVLMPGTAPDTTLDTWRRVIDVNLAGNFYLAKYGIPALVEAGGGVIIFTASELGTVGARETVAYCAAKGGLINMSRAVALDCAPLGIRVNCLAPGPIETPMLEDWFEAADDPETLIARQREPVPMKRFGEPEEIARVALFLASEGSSYMTGSLVVADGGATAWYGL